MDEINNTELKRYCRRCKKNRLSNKSRAKSRKSGLCQPCAATLFNESRITHKRLLPNDELDKELEQIGGQYEPIL